MKTYVRTTETQAPSRKGSPQTQSGRDVRTVENLEKNTGSLGGGSKHTTRIRANGPQRKARLSDEVIRLRIAQLSETLGFDVLHMMARQIVENIDMDVSHYVVACIEFESPTTASRTILRLAKTWN